jgi:hypothetical protein
VTDGTPQPPAPGDEYPIEGPVLVQCEGFRCRASETRRRRWTSGEHASASERIIAPAPQHHITEFRDAALPGCGSAWSLADFSDMKPIASLLLLMACGLCSAGEEPKFIAISNWSNPVDGCNDFFNGGNCATIRGRLVILKGHFPGDASDLLSTMVYVELQNLGVRPTEIYFDAEHGHDFRPEYKGGLNCDLFDSHDKPVPQRGSAFSGGCPSSGWITLQYDSTVRLRANCFGIRSPKEGGLVLPFPGKEWFIQPKDTNSYFLSATFTGIAPTNHTSEDVKSARAVVWDGTLVFPKTKISANEP